MKTNAEYWQEILNRYRVSKTIREIRKKLKINQKAIADRIGYSRQYVNNVQEIIIKPSNDFLNKLKEFNNGR